MKTRIALLLIILALVGCTPEAQRIDAEANKLEAEAGKIEAEADKIESETAQETQRETIKSLRDLIESLQDALESERARTRKWENRYHELALEIVRGQRPSVLPWILLTIVSLACSAFVAYIALRKPKTVVMIRSGNSWQRQGWLPEPTQLDGELILFEQKELTIE